MEIEKILRYSLIENLMKELVISESKINKENLFTLGAVNLLFYDNKMSMSDIDAFHVDGPNDGGIDYIYYDDEKMYIIQSKSSESEKGGNVKAAIDKMNSTLKNLKKGNYTDYNDKLLKAYVEAKETLDSDYDIVFVYITKSILGEKEKLADKLNKNTEESEYTEVQIYDYKDLLNKYNYLDYKKDNLIEEGKLYLYKNGNNINNKLKYGDKGLIVNVKGSSIKELYINHRNGGLFSYNLREYIKQKSVDTGIDETIEKEKENFWFYNNGLTIACREYREDGDNIKLYGFSVINGAQTMTKIGRSDKISFENDMAVVCKIVVVSDLENKYSFNDFITKISEATNSQKAIKIKDLRSNDKFQKELEKTAKLDKKYKLIINIKRGVKSNDKENLNKWQKIDNDLLGQLILAGLLQRPGIAKNAKTKIFENNKLYKEVFGRKHDFLTLYDLSRIHYIYNEYKKEFTKNMKEYEKDKDEANKILDKKQLLRSGDLFVLAIVLFLIKKYSRKLISTTTTIKENELQKDNVDGLLISSYPKDDLDEKMKNLFNKILERLYYIYLDLKVELSLTSIPNYYKNEKAYIKTLKMISDYFDEELNSSNTQRIKDIFEIFGY